MTENTTASGAADQYPSLYERTGNIEDINTLLVPRASLAAKAPAAEPFAYCQPDDPLSSTAFVWPGIKRDPRHTMPLYTAPPAPTEQWMPIETAPKDGSRLILTDGAKVFRGGFARLALKEHPDAYWMNFDDCDVCHPTHWQPEPALPAPPQGAAKGAT